MSREITPQFVIGLLILLFGSALFLDRLDLVNARYIIRMWPAIIIVLGALKLKSAQTTAETVGAVVWIAVGAWLILEFFDVVDLDPGDLFPVAIMVFGGYLVWRAMGGSAMRSAAAAAPDSSSRLSGFAIMGGLQRRSNSQDYRRGDFTAVMGACEVDLTQASMTDGEATIDVFAWMGGIEIRVPRDWTVSNKVFPLMGGAEDNTTPPATQTKHLVVRGMAFMGGVEVKN